MKKIILFLLGFILLCCNVLAAVAEESLPYLEMFQNDVPYKRYVLLTRDTCQSVCISPYTASRLYDWPNQVEPVFVVFSNPPADSYCRGFSVHAADYEDLGG